MLRPSAGHSTRGEKEGWTFHDFSLSKFQPFTITAFVVLRARAARAAWRCGQTEATPSEAERKDGHTRDPVRQRRPDKDLPAGLRHGLVDARLWDGG